MRRTVAWCAVERREHPSARSAVEAAVRTALSAIPDGSVAEVVVSGDGNGRVEARAVERPGARA